MKEVPCPCCQKLTAFSPDNTYRPFCSERCKLIDLGGWASEEYKIPTQEKIASLEESIEENEED
jgi:endogenous inhibitor of DNA gyrase (YacG/DUF329 family)